jgi:hypothetical protein
MVDLVDVEVGGERLDYILSAIVRSVRCQHESGYGELSGFGILSS